MGGTFDPIHLGHLVAAEEARYAFFLDPIIFVPSGHPPHKQGAISSAADRLAMTRLAVAGNPHFDVSAVEIERPGPSYAYDTIRHFQQAFADARLFFITGLDAILEIMSWYKAREVVDTCTFIAVSRPGYHPRTLDRLAPSVRERIAYLEIPHLSVSSSEIRERVRKGRPIRYLVPEAVERYIEESALYCGDKARVATQP